MPPTSSGESISLLIQIRPPPSSRWLPHLPDDQPLEVIFSNRYFPFKAQSLRCYWEISPWYGMIPFAVPFSVPLPTQLGRPELGAELLF